MTAKPSEWRRRASSVDELPCPDAPDLAIMNDYMRKGALLIISAPSGAGKTTICRKLLARRKDLRYSISCTTRPPRPGEKDGKHYFFLSQSEFKRKIQRGEFLEWAMVHD